jgi:uncharacterized protein YndB with AHSA1/START domain
MTTVDATHDVDTLTITFTSSFDAPPARVWQVWADAGQLSRWWGPPTWPATFTSHSLEAGGTSEYFMTGPDGTRAGGWWRTTAVAPPVRLEFEDGFADDAGRHLDHMPVTRTTVTLDAVDGGTRMTIVSRVESQEQLEKLLEMGMQEGMSLALGQIPAILAEG